jgi:hypothetical protein
MFRISRDGQIKTFIPLSKPSNPCLCPLCRNKHGLLEPATSATPQSFNSREVLAAAQELYGPVAGLMLVDEVWARLEVTGGKRGDK